MTGDTLTARMRELLPKLEYGRETHVQWRDCDQKYRDAEPSIGTREFHAEMVDEYDERIACFKAAIAYIESHP